MNLTVTQKCDVTVLTPAGEFTRDGAAQWADTLEKSLQCGHRDFVVDLGQLEGVDSAALEAFTALQRRCEQELGMVRFCEATPTLRKIFELTRLDRALLLHPHLQEALDEFQVIR